MSYILDALRKADAERRGVPAGPGMNEPAVLVETDDDAGGEPSATAARPWIWVLAGVGLALIAALVWNLWRASSAPPAPPDVAVAPPIAEPPPSTPPVAAAPPPAAPDADTDTLPRFPPPLPEPVRAEPPRADLPRAEAPAAVRQPPPPGIAIVPPPGAVPADRVVALADLPEATRREMPRLTIGGAMYSPKVADRMVVINGQVFHEGDTITRDMTLRQIKLKSAIVEFRGQRVEIGY